jgi:hypothetical protein
MLGASWQKSKVLGGFEESPQTAELAG